jgi:nucleotide-binding universal stress UspA family protein
MDRMLGRLLVAVDESQTANRAAALSVALAARHGSELLFCTAVDHAAIIAECAVPQGALDPTPILDQLDLTARTLVDGFALSAKRTGAAATAVLLDGAAAPAIVAEAEARAADAIVMGTQGKRGLERLFLGSTAEGVLRSAHVPTFIVHPGDAGAARPFAHIFVAIDDSEPAAAAAAFALELARNEQARLTLAHAIEKPGQRTGAEALLQRVAASAATRGVATVTVVVEGEPVAALLRAASELDVDVIVVGTHARRGLDLFLQGSVAAGIVRGGGLPVVVVPTGPPAEDGETA